MKTFNRIFIGLILGFVLMAIGSYEAGAASAVRPAAKTALYSYSTVISSITPFTVAEATTTLQPKPGAVYALIMSTGTVGDYIVLFDTIPTAAGSLTTGGPAGSPYQLGPRFFYSTNTANTTIFFDPPLIFTNGLMALGSSAVEQTAIVYELGRGTQQ